MTNSCINHDFTSFSVCFLQYFAKVLQSKLKYFKIGFRYEPFAKTIASNQQENETLDKGLLEKNFIVELLVLALAWW